MPTCFRFRKKKDIQSHRIDDLFIPAKKSSDRSSKKVTSSSQRTTGSVKKPIVKEPTSLVCYLCGKHFPQNNLIPHIKTCLKSWRCREENKPASERVPVPVAPELLSKPLPVEETDIEAFNQTMRSTWLKAINVRCKNCHKTFKANVYYKHIQSCQSKTNERRLSSDSKPPTTEETSNASDEGKSQKVLCRKPTKVMKPEQTVEKQKLERRLERSYLSKKTPRKILKQTDDIPRCITAAAQASLKAKAAKDKEKAKRVQAEATQTADKETAPPKTPKAQKLMRRASGDVSQKDIKKESSSAARRLERSSKSFSVVESRRRTENATEQKLPLTETVKTVKKQSLQSPAQFNKNLESRRLSMRQRTTDSNRVLKKSQSAKATSTTSKECRVVKVEKTVSTKETSYRAELKVFEKSVKKLQAKKSTSGALQLKVDCEVDNQSTGSSADSMEMPPVKDSPFTKKAMANNRASRKEAPLSDRGNKMADRPSGLRESVSADYSVMMRRPNRFSSQLSARDRDWTQAKVPIAYTCYLCGRQFGSASLKIHVRQCRQLWEEREIAEKPRKQDRRPVPPAPKELDEPLPTDREGIASFNERMVELWESRSLMNCPYCARTFTCEAFEKHQRVCTAQNPGGPHGLSKHRRASTDIATITSASSEKRKEELWCCASSRPTQFYCYLCGRQYGSHSLIRHISSCQKLWEDRESQKPRKQDRRPLPGLPPLLKDFPDVKLPTDPEEITEFNNAMYEYWDRVSLCVCQICGRSFKEESFEKHQKICTPENPGGVLGPSKQYPGVLQESSSGDSRKENCPTKKSQPKHYVCYLCGRQYGTESLLIHLPNCEKQWLANEAHKPKAAQRPLPPVPQRVASRDLPKTGDEIAKFNEEMTKHWEQHSLIKCTTCNRTFNSDAYEIHLRHCEHSKGSGGSTGARD